MASETGNRDHATPQSGAGVKRRKLLRFGTLITALTGASAISVINAGDVEAAPGDKNPSTAYVPMAEKGAPLGVATLDVESKIPAALLPDLSATIASVSVAHWKAGTAYIAGDKVFSPSGDVVTAKANFTSGASFDTGDWNFSPTYIPLGKGSETGIYKNAADKVSWTIGNAPGSAGFAGTGTPAKALGALSIYQKFGDSTGGTNVPITNTTQTAYLLANYYGPTVDDSAEAFSTFVGIKNTGTPFTQAKPVTGFESIAQVESGNNVRGAGSYALGVGSRINALGTAHIDDAFGFKASVNSSGGPVFGTIGRYIGFYQPVRSGAISAWGVYTADPIQSEKSLIIAKSVNTGLFKVDFAGSGGGNPGFIYAQNPQGTDMATMRLQAISGQTHALAEFWAAGAGFVSASITRLGSFMSTAGFTAQNSGGVNYWSFDTNGPKWAQASLTQTTVGPAGGAAALPATPKRYLKVTDYNGTVLVIPAYIAA